MRYLLFCFCVTVGLADFYGCGGASGSGPGTVTDTPRLEAVSDTALGLGYGGVALLAVRYLNGAGHPVAGQSVQYALGGETGGATLSLDRAHTGDDGRASVELTAGSSEASFHVTVSAAGASDLTFAIAVSRFAFVTLDARLAYTGAGMGTVAGLEALLYDDRPCARLPPSSMAPIPLRFAPAAGSSATIHFKKVRTLGYALVGRALDGKGRLLAYGCVDLQAAQFAGTGELSVPVPLSAVSPSVSGGFQLTTALAPGPGLLPAWDALTACATTAPAQPLLDAIVTALGPGPDADAIAAHRGTPDMKGCRPAQKGGMSTLDGALHSLLAKQGAPSLLLPAVVADLDAITATATLRSRLDITPADTRGDGAAGYTGTATLEQVAFTGAGGAHPTAYDPAALGVPIPAAGNISITTAPGSLIHIGKHAFTLRLAALWGHAAADIALTPRLLPADPRALLAAVAGAAMRTTGDHQLTGCDAIDDLITQTTGESSGKITSACTRALDSMGQTLAASFTAPGGIDFTLTGTATPVDPSGNLVTDSLASGQWTGGVLVAPMKWIDLTAPFTGTRIP